MKEILYILLDNYAEHEIGFMPGAVSTDSIGFRKEPKYINKMVAPTMEPVKSIGGMRTSCPTIRSKPCLPNMLPWY